MPDMFEFTIAKPSLKLDADRAGSVAVDVTSRLGRHGVVGVEVQPDEGADAGWFGPLEPAEFDLPDGETLQTTVQIAVPAEAEAGDYQFSVRAYAVDNPQQDFTNSPSISMSVPPPKEPGGIPKWIFILVAAVVLLIVGLVLWLVFGGGDEETTPTTTAPPLTAVPAPDLIGETAAVAREMTPDGAIFQVFPASGVDRDSACVALQAPPPGVETSVVSVLVVECPTPAPSVAVPEVLESVCDASFDFCKELDAIYGAGFTTDEEWLEASTAMAAAFVETFTIEGADVPNVVGFARTAAVEDIDESFEASAISDGSGGDQCVLFQHGYGGDLIAKGERVVLVTTRCPNAAQAPEDVALSTPIDVVTFDNVCNEVPGFCTSVDSGFRGPGYTTTPEFTADLEAMVVQFRNAFTSDVVPDVNGLLLGAAEDELEAKGLEAEYALPTPTPGELQIFTCWRVTGQNPSPGTLIANLDGDLDVALFLESEFCQWLTADAILVTSEVLLGDGG